MGNYTNRMAIFEAGLSESFLETLCRGSRLQDEKNSVQLCEKANAMLCVVHTTQKS